jgi:hypothetical protein
LMHCTIKKAVLEAYKWFHHPGRKWPEQLLRLRTMHAAFHSVKVM